MITKSEGVTETERILAEYCERSFLKLWSYPNPFKDDGHELCDLLAVFGDYIFIFFDREAKLPETSDKDPQILWDRWKRKAIDKQVKTAHGTERYIRSKRAIYLDAQGNSPFPIPINSDTAIFHKIIVAHGAKDACLRESEENIYGSLAISYCEVGTSHSRPFHVEIDSSNPVHIFDEHNLQIILTELDTITDLSSYLDEKLRAVGAYNYLSYCGEEDLLGHYIINFNKDTNKHVIGPKDEEFDIVAIGEGEWQDFIETEVYKNTKSVNARKSVV